jgi:hypothetical protein
MTDPYRAGAVWSGMLDFRDGMGPRKKYFVLLSEPVPPADFFVAALTTSQEKRYRGETTSACGCPACQCFRLEANEEKCFPLTTWIQFDNARPLPRTLLDTMQREKRAEFVQMLAPDRIRAVLKCALQSEDLAGKFSAQVSLALKALKVLTAPKKAQPAAPPTPMAAFKAKVDGHGPECRNRFVEYLERSAEELAALLEEKKPHPEGFLEDATAALELVLEQCQCPKGP